MTEIEKCLTNTFVKALEYDLMKFVKRVYCSPDDFVQQVFYTAAELNVEEEPCIYHYDEFVKENVDLFVRGVLTIVENYGESFIAEFLQNNTLKSFVKFTTYEMNEKDIMLHLFKDDIMEALQLDESKECYTLSFEDCVRLKNNVFRKIQN